ncbi:MAG: hypothetical protein Q8P13_00900 [bacterium]|nr:hypothetical protein [bacterium]
MFKSISLIVVAMVAILFVACGGDDNDEVQQLNEQIDAQAAQIATLQEQVKDLQAGQLTPNDIVSAIDQGFSDRRVGYSLTTRASAVDVDGQNRQFVAFVAFDAKIAMAEQYLKAGQVQNAKYLAEVALSDLGLVSCNGGSIEVADWAFPRELLELVSDLAPLYTFDFQMLEGEHYKTVITFQAPNPGC